MSQKRLLMYFVVVILLALIGTGIWIAMRHEPTELEVRSTPFSTHEQMLGLSVTARRLSNPSIDEITLLERGRLSTSVPGDGRIKLLNSQRETLFVLEFETSYVNTSVSEAREAVLMTFVVPYTPEVTLIRVETPQGSDETEVPKE